MDSSPNLPAADELLARAAWTRGLARRLVADAGAVDDAFQEAWISLAGKRTGSDPDDTSADEAREPISRRLRPAYLAKAVLNAARERARRDRARARRERAHARPEALPSTDELAAGIEAQRLLVDAVEALPEPYRRVVLLRHFEERSAAEIARREGVPAATVRVRHKRALERLREELDRRSGGDRGTWLRALVPLAARRLPVLPILGVITMKKVLLLPAAALVVAVGALTLRSPAPEPPAETARPDDRLVALTPASDARSLHDPGERAAQAGNEPATSARRSVQASTEVVLLEGRVLAPDGSPPASPVEVFAFLEPRSYRQLVTCLDEDASGRAGFPGLRATTTAGGAFRFTRAERHAAENEGGQLHVIVRGRQLYLPHTLALAAGPGAPTAVLSAICGTLVRGRVTDGSGAPLAGARVELAADTVSVELPLPRDLMRVTTAQLTNANGSFEFRAMPSGEAYSLLVARDGLAPRFQRLEDLPACGDHELHLALLPGGTVAGKVLDESGAPVADAEVEALLPGEFFGFDDRRVRRAMTDEDGAFALHDLPLGDVNLLASRAGFLESEREKVAVSAERALFGLRLELGRGLAVSGRLVDPAGAPVAAAQVRAEFDQGYSVGPSAFSALRGARGSAWTQEDGRFRITGLGRGPFRLRVELEGDGVTRRAAADGIRGETEDLELTLHPPFLVTGRVVDEAGAAASDARVRARRVADGAVGEVTTQRREVQVDGSGAFRLEDLPPGEWRVTAHAPESAPSLELAVELSTAVGANTVALGDLTVTPPASISGRVVGPDGSTISGAVVHVGGAGPPTWVEGAERGLQATTDSGGRFDLFGLRPGETRLVAKASGFASSEAVPVTLVAGEELGDVELGLRTGGTLTGLVYGKDGAAAEDMLVNLVSWQVGSFDARSTATDAEGEFAFDGVDPGTWQVVVIERRADWSSDAGGESLHRMTANMRTAQVTLRDGGHEHVIIGEAAAEPVVLRGRVLRGGEPFPDVILTFTSLREAGAAGVLAQVDDDARFEATVDGAGPYSVDLVKMGEGPGELVTARVRIDVPDVDEHRIDVSYPAGGISGQVLGPDGGPAAGARVTVLPGSTATTDQALARTYAEVSTDSRGGYRVEGLVGGVYQILVGGARFGSTGTADGGALGRVSTDGVVLADGEHRRGLDFTLPRPVTVPITVVDATGAPASGATVFTRDATGRLLDPLSSAVTDSLGRVSYAGLAPGEVTFFAVRGAQASSESSSVRVAHGDAVAVTLTIEPAGVLWLRPRNAAGETLEVTLSVTDEAGREVAAHLPAGDLAALAAEGAFGPEALRVGPLPPGRYRIVARSADGLVGKRRVALRAADERTVTLKLTE